MLSVRELAKKFTMDSAQTLCKDTGYIQSERIDWRPEEHGKSVTEILTECARGNLMMCAAIKGEAAPEAAMPTDVEGLKAAVIESAQEVCKAIDSMSDASLEGEITMPWGAIFPAADAIFLSTAHMTYHDGQVNYIQLLLGDTKFHWAEE